MMLGLMRRAGITSQMCYMAGMASIAASVASWMLSMKAEAAGIDRADRWGIFVGEWAPTFFALGVALRIEEQWSEEHPAESVDEMRRRGREAMPVG